MKSTERTEPILYSRSRLERRTPSLPEERIKYLADLHRKIQKRQDDSNASQQTSTGQDTTPVIIGVVIPVLIIAIILFVVWKRRQKLAKAHKGHDKYQSLDFGVDESALLEKGRRKHPKRPEMATTELGNSGRQRGISMDLGPTNPYLLPPEVASSRESIHSLSRSINPGDDKYRATTFVPDDGSIRSPSSLRRRGDDTSSWTGSSHLRYEVDSKTDLLPRKPQMAYTDSPYASKRPSFIEGPQRGLYPPSAPGTARNSTMSMNLSIKTGMYSVRGSRNFADGRPPLAELDTNHTGNNVPSINVPSPVEQPHDLSAAYDPDEQPKRRSSVYEPEPPNQEVADLEDMDYSFLAHYQEEEPPAPQQDPAIPEIRTTTYEPDNSPHRNPHFNQFEEDRSWETSQNRQRNPHQDRHGRDDSQTRRRMNPDQRQDPRDRERSQSRPRHPPSLRPDQRNHGSSQNLKIRAPPPRQNYRGQHSSRRASDLPPRSSNHPPQQNRLQQGDNHRSQQTSRTNSEVPPTPTTIELPTTPTTPHTIYDDDDDYTADLGDYAAYVGYTYRGSMIRPLPPDDPTENPEQRANRIRSFYKEYFDESSNGSRPSQGRFTGYYDGSEDYDMYGYYHRGSASYWDGRNRAMSQGSFAMHGEPRPHSSMSGRPRLGMKKKLLPLKPLMLLPSAHKLKDADFLPNAIDFAPPQVFKNQRSGSMGSLKGGFKPYAPGVRAHVPLNSSYDDLAVMPSAHALRKSGTFTGLDFAPPRRFKDKGDNMSDTGSIKSNRSNLSQMQIASIRNGAYRVSKIPKEVAGTRDDMYNALKPKWDIRAE